MKYRQVKSLFIYLLFGGAVAFLVSTLVHWIAEEMVDPVQMSVFIGIFLAFIFWVLYNHSRKSRG